jgi:hypothetical protein
VAAASEPGRATEWITLGVNTKTAMQIDDLAFDAITLATMASPAHAIRVW